MASISAAHLILYVRDQGVSTDFYTSALAAQSGLNLPGMTEPELSGGAILGLMPYAAIKRLLGDSRYSSLGVVSVG